MSCCRKSNSQNGFKGRQVKVTIGGDEYSGVWGESQFKAFDSEISMKVEGIPNVDKVNTVELNGVKFVREG